MKNNKIVAAFDVGGTLITMKEGPSDIMMKMVRALAADPNFEVVIWTAGDVVIAQKVRDNIGAENVRVMSKDDDLRPDIVFDDNDTYLIGKVNCLVIHEKGV